MVELAEDPDGRERYRACLESPEQLSVTATDQRGRRLPAQLLDLSAGGIGLSFPTECDPKLDVGDTIYLRLASPQLPKTLVALAQVSRDSLFDWGHCYGFKFVDWIGLLSQIPPDLAPLFNRRGQLRVTFGSKHMIRVAIEGPAKSTETFRPVQGVLRDVSATGLSFRVHPDAEEGMSACPFVHVSFLLPGNTKVLSFWVRILHRDADEDGLIYGAMFDQQATTGFDQKQEKLLSSLRQLKGVLDAEPS